jgi:hypothetical protein
VPECTKAIADAPLQQRKALPAKFREEHWKVGDGQGSEASWRRTNGNNRDSPCQTNSASAAEAALPKARAGQNSNVHIRHCEFAEKTQNRFAESSPIVPLSYGYKAAIGQQTIKRLNQ